MIDEKKIREAANEYANNLDNFVLPVVRRASFKAFKAGINWFLDNLWHPASKVPNYCRDCLVELEVPDPKTGIYKRGVYAKAQYEGMDEFSPIPWYGEEIENIFFEERGRVVRWLYIDDLLKGGNNG